MDRDRLLNAIRQYCLNNGFSKTAKEISVNLDESETIENVFEKYFEKENKKKIFTKTGLKFSINLPTGQMRFRKRPRDIDITEVTFFFVCPATSYSIGVICMKAEIAGSYRLIKTANFIFSKIRSVFLSGMNQVFI